MFRHQAFGDQGAAVAEISGSLACDKVIPVLAPFAERIEPERVLVMGDGRNDVEMFRWAREHGGRAVAMGQGPDEVRREASETTASVHSGGVADVLRAL